METIVVNLCAGPGAGKSTIAAQVFAELKWAGINCELATEYAKDRVWQKDYGVFESQPCVFGKQHLKLTRLKGKVDVIITDAPLIFSVMYDNTGSDHFKPFVVDMFNQFNNLNFFIKREKPYNPAGRMQTEDEAKDLDKAIKDILDGYNVKYKELIGDDNCALIIKSIVLHMLDKNR
jgi:hypothetical protein